MKALLSALLVFTALVVSAQEPPAPKPEDVASVDSIVKAVYDVISGPAGQKRDWDRMRSLFIPGARLVATGRRQDGSLAHRVLTVEDYIKSSGPMLEGQGFFESEVKRHVDEWANIAQVFSTYEARQKADDKQPFMRGINSIQLLNDGKRWWVVTIFWQPEDAQSKLP